METSPDPLSISDRLLEVTDKWFPQKSESILKKLWFGAIDNFKKNIIEEERSDVIASLILPFIGRLAAHSRGTISIHVKQGGVVFYETWKSDFINYLQFLEKYILSNHAISNDSTHKIYFGDITTQCILPHGKFSYMVTSPPYPNMKDYYAFFFPENYAIEHIFSIDKFSRKKIRESIIGTSIVSSFKKDNSVDTNLLCSTSARVFLSNLANWKGPKRSMADNQSYYIPYYYNYFHMLQTAFTNIEKMLADDCDAYIVVVNNTARKYVIPLVAFVKEIWSELGYFAQEDEELTNERAHVGSINPRVIGFKARHIEYAVRIKHAKR